MRRSSTSAPNVSAILSADERTALFDPPGDHDEATTRYSLGPDEIALTNAKRLDHNRLGFADQLGVDPDAFEHYAARDETRREHALEIAEFLGLRTIG